ncbi:MAG TPA: GNAT family N-acetyltransferase [Telluria sp.]|jgi:predicted GNAT family acetyltransferase|nr:GNAT family N-acetyltransferase [Telluria sp.]
MQVSLDVLERWLTAWSLARGLPLPVREQGGLSVEVGLRDQLRRYVFVDAGPALQACAARVTEPFVHLKAAVDPAPMRQALPPGWELEELRYLMWHDGAMAAGSAAPAGYTITAKREHGAHLVRFIDAEGTIAAAGRVVLHGKTASFDRVMTHELHRRKGLASAVMLELDRMAVQAGVSDRLLVATEAGRSLYLTLGWQLLAPYSTFIFMGTPGASHA